MEKSTFNSLFWKISIVFFILLAGVGVMYTYVSHEYSKTYLEEVNQRLNHDTAKNIVENSTNFYNGEVIKPALEEMFHHVRAINPSLEVYLVDPKGKIIAWYPPERKIALKQINLKPVLSFIANANSYIKGDDPLNPSQQKVFSASPLTMNNMLYAYIYVVLNGEQQEAASNSLFGGYLLKLGARTMGITLLFTFLIGLLIIRIITNNYSKILTVMQQFRQGDLKARVEFKSMGDERQLGEMFNEMADILTLNIDKLNEVENLRRELIANVSHDLRTPIAIIRGYVETLQMKEETITIEERKQYINTVRESAEKLERLVNELFELSKLEANQVLAKKEPFIISELVSDISSKYQLIAETKNISINTVLSKELPPVFADVSLIERVMQNLIDNALKFTPSGGKIEIKTIKSTDNNIEISVTDNGIGIPENDREQIFARYYKANNFTDLKNSTGLGLAIAKKILDLHQSTLDLVSKENAGSSFIFKLKCI
ncbi:sensor histidine kinase [Flavobacterium nackdongense]|uniref:histidine kinase n=1 Tax=Flavobacterium nackdongense TaxID=2547394 RepID=A0A4P6YC89_9FLAO|nr:HAMP domain-containing sensor histidine kinase [Flavobacterium nackdongense]QBN18295.1 HAMP domain-containing histidine kinase [Flavobacterium nackdongense]